MRHDVRSENLERFPVVSIVAVDQKLHSRIAVPADEIDRLGHAADEAAQPSARRRALVLRGGRFLFVPTERLVRRERQLPGLAYSGAAIPVP